MDKNISNQQQVTFNSDDIMKANPEVLTLFETWNYDNRSFGKIKAKGYTALTAEVNKENLKHDALNARLGSA